ncbi:MAG: hypothetical protein CMB16_00960 [Euryarchaeota archaeon]|nr:hypothetical protein [Euryarchaeota archaeon]|tara:strand:- start:778 stop:1506 length:729 start_codon:yes stop_codon:yes gene_type:complete
MKDVLQDIVAHTHSLGFLSLVKISNEEQTKIESMAEDRSVILNANTNSKVNEFDGVFGMPNLDKLALHLKCPEYQKDAKLNVVTAERNGKTVPTHIHFENAGGDFKNDYRFMSTEIINEKLKSVKFKGTAWEVEFEPSIASVQRFKLQAAAHTEETVFTVKTENNNLVFYFGDANSHAGSFIFQSNVDKELQNAWSWPIQQVMSILNLDGKVTLAISDAGAMQITVDSGIAQYNYILPAQTK